MTEPMQFQIGDEKFTISASNDPDYPWKVQSGVDAVIATNENTLKFMVDTVETMNEMYKRAIQREAEEIQARELAERELDLVFEQVGELTN